MKASHYLKELLDTALKAAEQAALEILDVYDNYDFETQYKEDDSPLTLADQRSHAVIEEYLKKTGLPVISEEGRSIDYNERRDWEYFWLVDPLDGTKEFIKRNGEFTVNIALIKNQTPVLGVVGVPTMRAIYFGLQGEGAFLRSGGGTVQLKKRIPADLTLPGSRVVASRSHMNVETQAFIDTLDTPSLVSIGSSLKFIAVAKGEADVYPRFIPCMEWDTAASDAIVREVGLSIKDVVNHQPLMYNKENLLNPFFICS